MIASRVEMTARLLAFKVHLAPPGKSPDDENTVSQNGVLNIRANLHQIRK
jgi:hypothetical protein